MENYKSAGDKKNSYKSDLYYNDSNFKTKMMHFPETLLNTVDNQFGQKIKVDVMRVDIDKNDYDKALEEEESYKVLSEHVEQVLTELNEKGKEKMFYLLESIDLTSHSVRTSENNMANWICRFIQIESGADVAICTGGALRSMRKYDKDHVFTLMDLNKMTAIIDHFEFVSVPGTVFVQILENGYRGLPNALGSFMHFAGANVVVDQNEHYDEEEVLTRDKDLFSKRIKEIALDLDDFDPKKNILLVGLHFMVEGKDGFSAFKKTKRLGTKDTVLTKNDALSKFFRLSGDSQIREEFMLFKKTIDPHITDSMIRVVQQKNDPYKVNSKKTEMKFVKKKKTTDQQKADFLTQEAVESFGLHEEFCKEKFVELLNTLKNRVLKRLRKYSIIQGLREIEGSWVFEINPKFFSKVVVK